LGPYDGSLGLTGGPLNIAVAGATGRMGRAVLTALSHAHGLRVSGALVRPGADYAEQDIGRLAGREMFGVAAKIDPRAAFEGAHVVIDFSLAPAVEANAEAVAAAGAAYVCCVTGLDDAQQAAVDAAATVVPVVQAGNTSLGVTLAAELVRKAAQTLDADYDVEIVETHHRRKIDAPSGTAILLAQAAARGRGRSAEDIERDVSHDKLGARQRGAFGFSSIRGGGVVGEHEVRLIGEREVVTISHSALDRGLFADGAIAAARWAAGRGPGLYSMADVLGL